MKKDWEFWEGESVTMDINSVLFVQISELRE